MNLTKRGFTLIELLVVIAIIGILSSVVLASLQTARAKGADAAVKSNLEQTRSQAELFYQSNGNKYFGITDTADDVCSANALAATVKGVNPEVLAASRAAGLATGVSLLTTGDSTHAVCNSSANAWAAQSPLKTSGFFCVDNSGTATTSPVTLVKTPSDYDCL